MEINETPRATFIDLSKVFNALSYDVFLYKLQYYGISGSEIKLLTSYLTN